MIAIWSTGSITQSLEIDGVTLHPFANEPPKGSPSIYLNPDGFADSFKLSDPFALFNPDDVFDIAIPAGDNGQSERERLTIPATWSDFPDWMALRDTPQTRWLRRLAEIEGHLGRAIGMLIDEKGLIAVVR